MSDSQAVDQKIASLPDWRGAMLQRIRELIKQAVPDVVEEVKWRKASNPLGVPTWSHHGIICTGETYRDKVKLTFARGAALEDRRSCSTPASTATHAGRSISSRMTALTKKRWRRW